MDSLGIPLVHIFPCTSSFYPNLFYLNFLPNSVISGPAFGEFSWYSFGIFPYMWPLSILFCFIRTCTLQSCCSSRWSILVAFPRWYCCKRFLKLIHQSFSFIFSVPFLVDIVAKDSWRIWMFYMFIMFIIFLHWYCCKRFLTEKDIMLVSLEIKHDVKHQWFEADKGPSLHHESSFVGLSRTPCPPAPMCIEIICNKNTHELR